MSYETSEEANMDSRKHQPVEHEAQVGQANREELVERIARAVREDGTVEPLKGIRLRRSSSPKSVPGATIPSFCVIAQGCKEIHLGEETYRYDPYHYLLATVDLPIASLIIKASKTQPYLGLVLELDPVLVGSVMLEAGHTASPSPADVKAIDVSPLDPSLLDAVVRLVRLVDSPTEAQFLAPLVTREIVYRLLIGKQSDRLRHIAVLGGYTAPIAQAIERLRDNFDQPLKIDDIAREIGMSVSGFHHHFKAVTALSPLQFQKQMRLQEARRLMLGEGLDAASAGYRVGYNDAAYFNREYKKVFGIPPVRDVERLREADGESTGLVRVM